MDINQAIATHQAARACCGNCTHWARHEDVRMPEHGHCAYRQAGHYTHETSVCLFNPSRFSARA